MRSLVRSIRTHADLYKAALGIGLTGYGGIAVLQQIRRVFVTDTKTVSEKTFFDALSLAQVIPGSTVVNLIAFFSYLRAGLIGAILATALYVLPPFLMTVLAAHLYFAYAGLPAVGTILRGLNILLIPLLINAVAGLAGSALSRRGKIAKRSVLISVVAFLLYVTDAMSVTMLILLSGVIGLALFSFGGRGGDPKEELEIVEGALFKRKKAWLLLVVAIGVFTAAVYDLSEPLWKLFSSFIRVGLLSFGGGVASLPLMERLFVDQLGWFTVSQFWDGVALTQLTPGPIFIVSAFIGYKVAGLAGAAVSMIAILIPSVVLVILAGKIHRRIRHLLLVQNLTTGFLAGFIGMLSALIVGQVSRTGITGPMALTILASLVLIRTFRYGVFPAALLCFGYPFVFSFR